MGSSGDNKMWKMREILKDLRRCGMTILILIVASFLFIKPYPVSADRPTVKAEGILTSIEEDGTVIIDGKGYKVDRSVLVVDLKGRPVSLHKLSLPGSVRFEYRYDPDGFVIEYIEQIKGGLKRRAR